MAIPNQFEQKKSKQSLELSNQIQELKKKKNAVILAHYYQDDSIQELQIFWEIVYTLLSRQQELKRI